jgi:hypothetical protein
MFHQISDVTKNWNKTPAQGQAISPTGDNSALQSVIAANTEAVNKLAASLKGVHQTAFSKYPAIDLTTAHTDLAITVVRPVDFIQIWCDGSLDGMSIKIGSQSNPSLDFKQIQIIRVTDNPETIYFTNDVRQGRSHAVIYFVGGDSPLTLTMGGQDISLAEQAVRNGSIHSFDRRGEIIHQEDFEQNLNKVIISGANSQAYISSYVSKSGSVSCYVSPQVGLGNIVALSLLRPYIALTPFGLEAYFTHSDNNCQYRLVLGIYDGTNYHNAYITWNGLTANLQINTPGGLINLASLPALGLDALDRIFNVAKLVIDPITHKYKRLLINNMKYDLSVYSYPLNANGSPPNISPYIELTNKDGNSHHSYISNLILTQNEP